MKVNCKGCGKTLDVPENAVGKTLQCPGCQHRFTLQVVVAERPAAPPARTPARPSQSPSESPLDDLVSAATARPTWPPGYGSVQRPLAYRAEPPSAAKWLVPSLIALGVIGIVVFLLVQWGSGGWGGGRLFGFSSTTMEQFKARIMWTGQPSSRPKENFFKLVGQPDRIQQAGEYLYFYYRCSDGELQLVVDRKSYEQRNRVVITRVNRT